MKRAISLLLVLIMAFSFVNVYANDSELSSKIIISNDNGNISLSLRITGEAEPSERVSVKILRPGVDEKNSSLSLFEKYVYIGQTRADSNGEFLFEIPFNEAYGNYIVKATNQISGKTEQGIVAAPSSERMNEILSNVNNKIFTDKAMDEYLVAYAKEVGVDITIYAQLEDNVRYSICESVLEDTYVDFSVLFETIEKTTLLVGIDKTKKLDLIDTMFSYYDSDYLNITSHPMYPVYKAYGKGEKNTVLTLFANSEIKELSDINKAFAKAIFTNEVKTVSNYKEISAVIKSYASHTGLDLTGYGLLDSNKQDKVLYYVSRELKSVSAYSDFEGLFVKTVNDIDSLILAEKNTLPLPGGSGGGGGGSSVSIGEGAVPTLPDMVDNGNDYVEKETEEFVPDYEGNDVFTDLGAVEWAREAILSMNSAGILSGRENKKFFPNDNTTRAEFLKMLTLTFNIKDDGGKISFGDVSESDWFYPYVKTAYTNGIIKGIGNGLFGPNDYITRQDAATVIYKAMTLKNYISLAQVDASAITDYNSISDYAKNAVLMLNSYGVISGYTDGSFKPKQRITRAECAVLLNKITGLEKVIEAEREIVSETDGLLGVGSIQVVNQFSKPASKPLNDGTVYSLDSETDYVGQIRNINISTPGSEFNTSVLYLDFDLNSYKSQYKKVEKALINVLVKYNDAEGFLPEGLSLCAYEYDPEGTMKRYPTDQAYIGKMLSSKVLSKDFNEKKSAGFYTFTFDVTEAVNNSLISSGDILRLAFTLDSEELKGFTNEIVTGKNLFTGTDFSIGIVLNTAATRKHNGTTIVYGDSQPVLNLYQ